LLGDLLDQNGSENQGEAPVKPAEKQRDDRHKNCSANRIPRQPAQPGRKTVQGRGQGQHVSQQQDKYHLHGKCQQFPESFGPAYQHIGHSGQSGPQCVTKNKGKDYGKSCQAQGKDQRIRHGQFVFLHRFMDSGMNGLECENKRFLNMLR
jgi:hypothetical protein